MGNRPTALDHIRTLHVDLTGRVALVTGCTSGMGVEIARALATAGASVFITGRNVSMLDSVCEELNKGLVSSGLQASVHALPCDLASFASIRSAAASFLSHSAALHLLVCNAGLMNVPYELSVDGADLQMAVNHIGHVLLFTLLEPLLLKSAPSRVVSVTSTAWYEFGPTTIDYLRLPSVPRGQFSSLGAYQQSKLAVVLFTQELHALYSARGLTAYAVNPGVFRSGLQRGFLVVLIGLARPFLKSKQQAAASPTWCAVAKGIEKDSGGYFSDSAVSRQVLKTPIKEDEARKMWAWTLEFIRLHP